MIRMLTTVTPFVMGIATGSAVQGAAPDQAICAVQQAIACSPTEICDRSLPAAVNLPVLLRVDLEDGVVVSRQQSGAERTSQIGVQSGDDAHHIVQGMDEGTAWSMVIDLETGQFTIASAHADVGYTAFGVCSASLLD